MGRGFTWDDEAKYAGQWREQKWREITQSCPRSSIQQPGPGLVSTSLSVPWRAGLLRKAVSVLPEPREPETRAWWVRKMQRQADEPSQGAKWSHQQVRGPTAPEHIWKPMISDFQSLSREKPLLFPQFVFFPGGLVSGTGRSVYSCVTLGKSRNLSGLQLVHWQNGTCNCHSF